MNRDMREKEKYKVSIFGETYTLISDESHDHINKVVDEVNNLMSEISRQGQIVQPHKVAVLAAIQLASKNIDYNNQSDKLIDLFSKIE